MRTSYKESEREIGTLRKTVTFEEPDRELMRAGSENPNKQNMSGELDAEESASGVGQDQGDKVFFGEFKRMIRSCTSESAMEA